MTFVSLKEKREKSFNETFVLVQFFGRSLCRPAYRWRNMSGKKMRVYNAYLKSLVGNAVQFVSSYAQVAELVKVHKCSPFDVLNTVVVQMKSFKCL